MKQRYEVVYGRNPVDPTRTWYILDCRGIGKTWVTIRQGNENHCLTFETQEQAEEWIVEQEKVRPTND